MKKPAKAGFIFPNRGGTEFSVAGSLSSFGATDSGYKTPSDSVISLDYMVVRIWPEADMHGLDAYCFDSYSKRIT